ncbi:MAG: hypothetical protein GY821_15475 [Gammaproteobacteria bacterium]|nr:hypothetical protein [Gammaproteobacteria bacterium]
MWSKICGLIFLSLSLAVVTGCSSQGGYGAYICDPNSAYANGMIDARSGKAMNVSYGASCPVQTWAMRTSYRRGYERGVLLSPLPGGEHPLPALPPLPPVKKPLHPVSFEPQKVEPPPRPAGEQPVYLNRPAPNYYHVVAPIALNTNARAQPWPPTAATGYPPMKAQPHAASNQQPWPPTASTRYKWMTLSGQQWPQNDMAPPTRFTTAQPVTLKPTPTTVVATTRADLGQQHSSVVIPPPTALTTAQPVVLNSSPVRSTAAPARTRANHHHHASHYRSDAYHKQPPHYRHDYHHRHPVHRRPPVQQKHVPAQTTQVQQTQHTSQPQIAYIAMN